MPDWDFSTTFMQRMKDPRVLTFEHLSKMLDWLKKTPVGIDGILSMRLAIQQEQTLQETRRAIETFNQASSRLTNRIYWQTWALLVLTNRVSRADSLGMGEVARTVRQGTALAVPEGTDVEGGFSR